MDVLWGLTYGLLAQFTPAYQPVYQLEAQLNGHSSDRPAPLEPPASEPLEDSLEDDELELDSSDYEVRPFAPTVFLEGEVILGVSGVAGDGLDDSVVFQESVEFKLNVSFTGDDLLEIGVESGNATEFSFVDELTFEGRLSFPGETESDRIQLSELSYEFPIGDRTSVYISAIDHDLDDFNPLFGDSSTGALSEFGNENPIHTLVGEAGLQLNHELTDGLSVSLGYFGGEANDPDAEGGLFNGNHSAFAQVGFEPSDRLLLGFTYIHSYSDTSLETETGSVRSQVNLERPVIGNSYGFSALFSPNSRFSLGGWVGVTKATVLNVGDADVWNYALTLAFPDLGQEGNFLGVVVGQEPRLTGTSGFTIGDRQRDPDTSLHLEAFYSHQLSDHIAITPGLIWITAPDHDQSNPDILVVTVRTTFEF
jgi:Carbohydrate-selective porin, OprB family